MASADPKAPWAVIVDPSHTTDARMMTTLLIVFPKACVTGATLSRVRKATSL